MKVAIAALVALCWFFQSQNALGKPPSRKKLWISQEAPKNLSKTVRTMYLHTTQERNTMYISFVQKQTVHILQTLTSNEISHSPKYPTNPTSPTTTPTPTHTSNPAFTKLLILNGEKYNPIYEFISIDDEYSYNLSTNIVSFDSNENITAPPLSNFNILGSGGAGGLLNGKAVYCGGWDPDNEGYSNACFKLGDKAPFFRMKLIRVGASYVVVNDQLFMIGGFDEESKTTTEFVALDQETVDVGPALPFNHSGGCATLVAPEKVLVTGGYGTSDKTFFFDFDNPILNWVKGPAMKVGREDHGCASLNGITILTGGYTVYDGSVEVLSPSNLDFWRFSKFQF